MAEPKDGCAPVQGSKWNRHRRKPRRQWQSQHKERVR